MLLGADLAESLKAADNGASSTCFLRLRRFKIYLINGETKLAFFYEVDDCRMYITVVLFNLFFFYNFFIMFSFIQWVVYYMKFYELKFRIVLIIITKFKIIVSTRVECTTHGGARVPLRKI